MTLKLSIQSAETISVPFLNPGISKVQFLLFTNNMAFGVGEESWKEPSGAFSCDVMKCKIITKHKFPVFFALPVMMLSISNFIDFPACDVLNCDSMCVLRIH